MRRGCAPASAPRRSWRGPGRRALSTWRSSGEWLGGSIFIRLFKKHGNESGNHRVECAGTRHPAGRVPPAGRSRPGRADGGRYRRRPRRSRRDAVLPPEGAGERRPGQQRSPGAACLLPRPLRRHERAGGLPDPQLLRRLRRRRLRPRRDVDAPLLIPPPHHLIHHEALPMKHRVLFLCTGNSARSVLAEATLCAWAGDRYEVSSAGSRPIGTVNPWALAQLADEGIPTDGLRSKSWDEFATADAAPLDLVVTVCGSAAAETCPAVFGDFMRTHWGLPDPAAVEGDDA